MAYSMVRFWSYIFTPLLIIVIIFAMFVIFTLSSAQTTVGSLIAPALAITSSVAATAASGIKAAAATAVPRVSFSPTSVGTGP
jgi:hypothetical protein